jgi:uncharacterized membrane protein YcaP (DUF421 family)
MKPDEIRLSDWNRIIFGEAPPEFFIELVIRTVFLFVLLVIAMRLLGRRMAGQVNRIEMIALFSLAAAIGVPLQAPDRGLLPSIVIALVVIAVGKLVTAIAFRHQRFEAIAEDEYATLVMDGVIQMEKMRETRLTVERLYAQLRKEGIRHLGEVKRLYFEANGSFSLVKNENPPPGLAIIPAFDQALLDEQRHTQERVCDDCGNKQPLQQENGVTCRNCGNDKWVQAIE